MDFPEPPNTEFEVEFAFEDSPTDDEDSVLVKFSAPEAVVGTLPPKIPPELEDAPPPNTVLLGAEPPKTGLPVLIEDKAVEASGFFTVTEVAEELERGEPKAGGAAAGKADAVEVDDAETEAVVETDLAPKFNTEDDDEAPIFVNVVSAVSKFSLVAAETLSPPEGAVDGKPKPGSGADVDPSVGTAVADGIAVFASGTGLAEPNENPEAEAADDVPNPGVGADVVTDFVVGMLNGVLDPDDDKERPKPRPGLLESPRFVLVAVCAGKESDALPPPKDRPPDAEEEPKLNPAPALVVTGLAIAETPVPADEYAEKTGFEIEDGAPKGGGAEENPLLTALSSLAGDIAS